MKTEHIEKLDALIEPILRISRIPGAAIAVVAGGEIIFAKGYGYRDLPRKLPMTAGTVYPIASTTKAMNTTLLAMLVEEGKLAWDAPVRDYLPSFRLGDPLTSAQITLRDLVTMRTGLPRHDWLWTENAISRPDLVKRLGHLELSAGFRERFQYNNLTSTTAGHIAELVTGRSWEELAATRIFAPLEMRSTTTTPRPNDNEVTSYHENTRRELVVTRRLATEVTAPSGGSVRSTVEDMARWALLHLNGGTIGERTLIKRSSLAETHSPQVVVGADPSAPTPNAAYGMGWFIDFYNGCPRVSHGGYLHDVNSELMLFPKHGIGFVAFSNFGPPALARQILQHSFDLIMGFEPVQSIEKTLEEYEKKVEQNQKRNLSVQRVPETSPSHPLQDYAGCYVHPGYGPIHIERQDRILSMRRHKLELSLVHWHYDVWRVADNDLFVIHRPQPFERASPIVFETNADGKVSAFTLQLEPAVAPIRFTRE